MDKKRKPKFNKKREPMRSEFSSQNEYQLAWVKWRENRDNNNDSVKRSREAAKERRYEIQHALETRQEESQKLEESLTTMKTEVQFLKKVLKSPDALTPPEQRRLRDIVSEAMTNMA